MNETYVTLRGWLGADVRHRIEPDATHDLIDQPTRWLTAAQDVVADPQALPALLDRLLGPHPEKWSATEHSRAAALRSLVEALGHYGLAVEFVSGRRYLYREVPEEVAERFRGAFAKGRFFNARIRDRYPCEPLEEDAETGA